MTETGFGPFILSTRWTRGWSSKGDYKPLVFDPLVSHILIVTILKAKERKSGSPELALTMRERKRFLGLKQTRIQKKRRWVIYKVLMAGVIGYMEPHCPADDEVDVTKYV